MSGLVPQHDRFFKALMARPGAAAALLRERLPPDIASLLGDEPPELLDGGFVDEALAAHQSDLLLRVKTTGGGEAFVYTLVEHKSTPAPRVALQILRYMTRIWDRFDREGPDRPLPAVYPLVVYHGTAPWTVPPHFAALVAAAESWRPHLLDFPFGVLDLGRVPDRALSADPGLRAGLMILKRIKLPATLPEALEDLLVAARDQGMDFLVLVIRYIMVERNGVDRDLVRRTLSRVLPEEGEEVMSIAAQEWIAEGRLMGLQEGRQEGRQEQAARMLLHLLRRRFGDLPDDLRGRVESADIATLEAWSDRVLDAPTLDAVFAPH